MNFKIITLFPELFENFKNCTLVSKAIKNELITLDLINFRDFAINNQGQVDDSPYGGGGGMVARVDASVAAIESVKTAVPNAKVILFSPRGKPLTQKLAKELYAEGTESKSLILFCNRYEGVDERFVRGWVDHEISVGDAIYMGGEVPAMAFLECISRLVPGVLGNEDSIKEESFELDGLEYPQYTKPREFRGYEVPEILLSGNHGEIANWRTQQSSVDTILRRPDLLKKESPVGSNSKNLKKTKPPVYLGLVHYPVVDKHQKTVVSSITNLDVHDISRSVKTFGLDGFFVMHPSKILRRLIKKICDHWSEGAGLEYNANRSEALSTVISVAYLEDAIAKIEKLHGKLPRLVITSAQDGPRSIKYETFRENLPNIDEPIFILFGTAWGIHQSIVDQAEFRLSPIWGPTEYNHLSVRSAVAIVLDRLFGS